MELNRDVVVLSSCKKIKNSGDRCMLCGETNLFSRPIVCLTCTRGLYFVVGTRRTSVVTLCFFVARLLSGQFVVFARTFKMSQLCSCLVKWVVICYCTWLKWRFLLAFHCPSTQYNCFCLIFYFLKNTSSCLGNFFKLLAPELFFLILAHPVYKMWIIQEPNTLELSNKLHF